MTKPSPQMIAAGVLALSGNDPQKTPYHELAAAVWRAMERARRADTIPCALIEHGVVFDVVEWDGASDWMPPKGTRAIPTAGSQVRPGWSYGELGFQPPPKNAHA